MAGFQARDTMPKLGHVTDLREQWLVRADGALAHRLQDREISSRLCENRCRNQQIREDFPVALGEQQQLESEARGRERARRRQAERDADIARQMAEIHLRRQRAAAAARPLLPGPSRAPPPAPAPAAAPALPDISPDELGLSPAEVEEMRRRLWQEERDARLARELSHADGGDALLAADMRCAVEAQDGELARLLQEREYKKLQRAKEKAKQKALLKKQQRLSQQQSEGQAGEPQSSQAQLLDAYSNPQDLIRETNGMRLCKSVDSDLNYVEPFEKEQIQSKASALQSKEISKQYYNSDSFTRRTDVGGGGSHDDTDHEQPSSHSVAAMQHRQPPPPPAANKKPRFPDPVSIRPASHYPTDQADTGPPGVPHPGMSHSYSDNNNVYTSTFPPDYSSTSQSRGHDRSDPSKRLSVISDITAEALNKKKNKQEQVHKKRKGCKIQ
ncbi:unnamed protein product [Plutella xylostella]|uniref:(diamondback moth) hypothetical protein n=1 Tax=Plutella xylostella TaxID=51655 RepID=A0A8S4FIF5_PLUXY|nr:unnamed protein product [Plutella xylostella]